MPILAILFTGAPGGGGGYTVQALKANGVGYGYKGGLVMGTNEVGSGVG